MNSAPLIELRWTPTGLEYSHRLPLYNAEGKLWGFDGWSAWTPVPFVDDAAPEPPADAS